MFIMCDIVDKPGVTQFGNVRGKGSENIRRQGLSKNTDYRGKKNEVLEYWSIGVLEFNCTTPSLHFNCAGVFSDSLNVLNDLDALNGLGDQRVTRPIWMA